jgi:hypothetical protein
MSGELQILKEELQEVLSERYIVPQESAYGAYSGPDLEVGGTSRKGDEVAAIRDRIAKKGLLKEGDVILDFGAGRFARNANYLRSLGFKVYAYDPYNHNGKDPWADDGVSKTLPKQKFDVVFSSYVLNVLQTKTMEKVIREMESLSTRMTFHVTRNEDVIEGVKNSIKKKSLKTLLPFLKKNYGDTEMIETIENGGMPTDAQLADLSVFGYATKDGFQIIPFLENYGYSKLADLTGYKVYIK